MKSMTVMDLIMKLCSFDPDMPVMLHIDEEGCTYARSVVASMGDQREPVAMLSDYFDVDNAEEAEGDEA